uniref:HNH endonuclease n=1 Tax=Marseillevirus LCMAC101 TaxID=2506602 RepID=A0A481YRV3_9VIRU|nr:MAG: HNH endonuclease [Marseillevirus LCMAC101]
MEWVTRSDNVIHSHKNSNPDRYSTSKIVKQYDLEGVNTIGEYRSISEASRQTGCSNSGISQVCLGLSESTKGSVFKYSDKDALNQPAMKYTNKVDLVDKKENIIETYKSVRTAAIDLKISYSSIYEILRGDRKKTRTGYRFRYH